MKLVRSIREDLHQKFESIPSSTLMNLVWDQALMVVDEQAWHQTYRRVVYRFGDNVRDHLAHKITEANLENRSKR